MGNGVHLPDKLYFKIGEVAALIGVETHVLRYWETEFPQISPAKSESQQRLYRRRDVEFIIEVFDLLYRQKYTIAGARRRLREFKRVEIDRVKSSQMGLKFEDNKALNVNAKLEIRRMIAEMDAFLLGDPLGV